MSKNTQENPLALMKKDVVDVVESRVQDLIHKGELHLPADYSAANAMKSAWLIMQSHPDRDKLLSCSKDSIANSLFDMVVQGLNPTKKQCYFIPYGGKLSCQPSYFGEMLIAKRVDPTIGDIIAQVVYEGDTLKYKIVRGKKVISDHEQDISNVDNQKIIAAYCMILEQDGSVRSTEIMTWDEIKRSWGQSPVKPIDEKGNVKPSSTHGKFPADMAMRTVTRKACKPIINSSDDKTLVLAFNRASDIQADQEVADEIAENANGEIIDIEAETPETDEKQPETEEKQPENEGKEGKVEQTDCGF